MCMHACVRAGVRIHNPPPTNPTLCSGDRHHTVVHTQVSNAVPDTAPSSAGQRARVRAGERENTTVAAAVAAAGDWADGAGCRERSQQLRAGVLQQQQQQQRRAARCCTLLCWLCCAAAVFVGSSLLHARAGLTPSTKHPTLITNSPLPLHRSLHHERACAGLSRRLIELYTQQDVSWSKVRVVEVPAAAAAAGKSAVTVRSTATV